MLAFYQGLHVETEREREIPGVSFYKDINPKRLIISFLLYYFLGVPNSKGATLDVRASTYEFGWGHTHSVHNTGHSTIDDAFSTGRHRRVFRCCANCAHKSTYQHGHTCKRPPRNSQVVERSLIIPNTLEEERPLVPSRENTDGMVREQSRRYS